jgi:iron(III) transport system ATP-binding protein
MSSLSIHHLAKAYGPRPVLHHVDLDVMAGTLTAVLGASGCGKTTLLRIVAGFATPDAGTVTINDRVVHDDRSDVPPERRNVGFVAQDGALFPHLSVAANVGFGLPRRQRRGPEVAAMLELVGLPARYVGRYPHQLSGGEQQRVALARALAPEPAVVLLDEPFTSLDATLRTETRQAVAAALAASATTGLLVTHDQSEALSLAQQVAVLRDGAIIQTADPKTLYQVPIDPALAGFIGDAIFLDAEISAGVAMCPLGRLALRSTATSLPGRAIVMIRPEQVRWQRLNDQHHETSPACPQARVTGLTYHGHDAMVHLVMETGNGHAPVTISLRTPGHHLPHHGEQVRLSVDGPVVAYPADGL